MKTPISQKRLAANRANAVRSTGPRTAEGKTRSAQNARRHGFTAATFAVLRIEDVHELETLRAEAIHVYQPVNSEELFAVERMALCKLSIFRAARLEGGMFSDILNNSLNDNNITPFVSLDPCLEANPKINQEQIRAFALANGFNRMMRGANGFSLLLRYQTLAERQYRRAVEEFERLKRLRPELPNEPIEEPDLTENTPDPALDDEPDSTPAPPSTADLDPDGDPDLLDDDPPEALDDAPPAPLVIPPCRSNGTFVL
jgi:hypothetical protein